jgi:HKD family nuclease
MNRIVEGDHRQPGTPLLPCLFAEGLAAVIGLPAGFDLSKKLSESRGIKIATAFAHMSGWKLIKDAVLGCRGQVEIVAGLHFFQTEPQLLKRWLKESYQSEKFTCKVVSKSSRTRWTFHPKVLIVKADDGNDFAIVGSGNLSAGGLRDNIECSLYTEDQSAICNLERWFQDICEKSAKALDEPTIRWYSPLYKKYRSRNAELVQAQSKDLERLNQIIETKGKASLRHWQQAVEDAKNLFAKPGFNGRWERRREAARKIRECLQYPQFDIRYDQWQEFLKIREFGNLAALNLFRKTIIKRMARVGSAFGLLIDDSKDIRARLQSVLAGSAKIRGIDVNVITKLLTVHDRKRWPVYNSRVHDVLSEEYGYEMPRGLTKTDKYLAYAKLMQRFAEAAQAKDMWALDVFFSDRFQKSRDRGSD